MGRDKKEIDYRLYINYNNEGYEHIKTGNYEKIFRLVNKLEGYKLIVIEHDYTKDSEFPIYLSQPYLKTRRKNENN